MVQDTTAGFKFMYRLSGGPMTVQKLYFKDTETLTKGDMLNLETGEVDLAATGDTAFIGVALQTLAGTDSTTLIEVCIDDDAVYAVYDANVRKAGALLDLSGATGAQTIAAASNNNFVVMANSSADQWTLVRINLTKHALHL
jgi:hypothetical protein